VYENNPLGIINILSSSKKNETLNYSSDNISGSNCKLNPNISADLTSKDLDHIAQQLPVLQKDNSKQIWFYNSDSEINLKFRHYDLESNADVFVANLKDCLKDLRTQSIKQLRIVSIKNTKQEDIDFIAIDIGNILDSGCYAEILGLDLILNDFKNFKKFHKDQFHEWTVSGDSFKIINDYSVKMRPQASLSSWCAVNANSTNNIIHSWLHSIRRTANALNQCAIPSSNSVSPKFDLSKSDYLIYDQKIPWILPTGKIRSASCFYNNDNGLISIQLQETKFKGKPLLHDASSEIFVFSAPDEKQLISSLHTFRKEVEINNSIDLRQSAKRLSHKVYQNFRIAIVANNQKDLLKKIDKILLGISKRQKPPSRYKPGLTWNTSGILNSKIAAVFPGQGSQRYNMLKSLCIRFPKVREWYDSMEAALSQVNCISPSLTIFPPTHGICANAKKKLESNLYSQEGGNAAVIVSSIALNELMSSFGCYSDILVGHSSGEISGLVISKAIKFPDRASLFEAVIDVNQKGAQGDIRGEIPKGKFLAVTSSNEEVLEKFLMKHKDSVYLAMDNCPQQKVLFFLEEEYQECYDELIQLGVICFPLYFERAYHTELFEVEMPSIRNVYNSFDLSSPNIPVFSCINLVDFPEDANGIRELACLNWTHCVRFKEACEILYDRGVRTFIEMGPSGVLSGFISNTLQKRPHNVLPLDQEGVDSYTTFLNVLAKLFTEGVDVNLDLLFDDYKIKPQIESHSLNDNNSNAELYSHQEEFKLPRIQIVANQNVRSMIMKEHFAFMNTYLEMQTNMLNAVQLAQKNISMTDMPNAYQPQIGSTKSVDQLPMIDRIKYYDETTCIAQRTISRNNDLFLMHHTLGRFILKKPLEAEPLPVVPLAMNLEMMVEAASLLAPDGYVVTDMYDIKAVRWMTIDDDTLNLNIETELLPQSSINQIRVRVKVIEENRPLLPYCLCDVIFKKEYSSVTKIQDLVIEKPKSTLWDAESFFEQCLFHGKAFSSMTDILGLGDEAIEVELAIPKADNLFKQNKSPQFLTQAQVLDVPGHAVAWWQVECGDKCFGIFPISIDHIQFFAPPLIPESLAIGRGKNKKINNIVETEFEILNKDGSLHIKTTGFKFIYYKFQKAFLRSHYWPGPNSFYSEPINFSNPNIIGFEAETLKNDFFKQSNGLWLRSLIQMYCSSHEEEQWKNLNDKGSRKIEWFLGRVAAKEIIKKWAFYVHSIYILCPEIEIVTDNNGRPYAVCPDLRKYGPLPDISITHSSSVAIAIAADSGFRVGVDLEYFPEKSDKSLLQLNQRLEIAFTESELSQIQQKKQNTLYELVCAKEAASKAIGIGFLGFMKSFEIKSYNLGKVEIGIFGHTIEVDIQKEKDKIIATCIIPQAQAKTIINQIDIVESV